MNRIYVILLTVLAVAAAPGAAQQLTRQAEITGNAVDGKCTIEVDVDGSAEVEVQGNTGRIRNLSGQRAAWRRFVCNGQMPQNPGDFRFRGIDGRGHVQLVQDPRQNGGRVVFRIDDPKGGREGYTVDLEWRGSGGSQWNNQDNRGWNGPGNNNRYYEPNGRWNANGTAEAVRVCESAAADRIRGEGFRNISFRNVVPDNNPGRNDFVTGTAMAGKGKKQLNKEFVFSCSVNLVDGNVRSIDVRRGRK